MSLSSSSLNEGVNGDAEVGGGGGVEAGAEEAVTWLIGADCFSTGLPWRSKKSSANLATSSDDISSTSFPMISRMRGGIVLKEMLFDHVIKL